MTNNIIVFVMPWILSIGAAVVFALVAFILASKLPKYRNQIRTVVWGLAVAYGLFVIGPLHAGKEYGDLFFHFAVFNVLCILFIYLFNRRFGVARRSDTRGSEDT